MRRMPTWPEWFAQLPTNAALQECIAPAASVLNPLLAVGAGAGWRVGSCMRTSPAASTGEETRRIPQDGCLAGAELGAGRAGSRGGARIPPADHAFCSCTAPTPFHPGPC